MFQVIVGNIGTVYTGNSYTQAMAKFTAYVKQSISGTGRASGESVIVLHNGEPQHEHLGVQS